MKRLFPFLSLLSFSLSATLRADSVVVFNEIMYHPATNEPAMEWIEFHNQLAVDVDISHWSVSGGIEYTFPSNTIVRGRGYLVLAVSPAALSAATGSTNVTGPFTGRLSNNGERLELRNNSGRLVDEVEYGVDGNWPVAPDGSGVSLAKRDRDSGSAAAASWTWSAQLGGTPGAENFPTAAGFVAPPGLVSYWNFNEPGGSNVTDLAGRNHGVFGTGVTHSNASGVGGSLAFDGTGNAFVNVGPGALNNFAVSNGITIEAVLLPGWSGNGNATIFRRAPRPPAAYHDTVLADQPLAYWRLNDSTTTITDASGNNRTGTATAGVSLNQPGLIATDPANNAVSATGTQRITVPGFEKIGSRGYTVEFWVKVNALPNACCQNLVGDGEGGGDYFMMNYILGPGQGQVGAIRPHYGPNNSPVSMDSATALQVGGIYHIVTTWDATKPDNNAVIYINGVADRVGTVSRNLPAAGTTGSNMVFIGYDNREVPQGNYTYDEVALYNYPLSQGAVASHYLAATATDFNVTRGHALQLALQNDANNAAALPPVAPGPVLSFGLTVGGVYSELDMPLDGRDGRPTLADLENGQPHHLAATYDRATGVKAIYLDGVLRFSTTLSGAISTANGVDAIIGNAEAGGDAPFTGTLDEVTYWSRALADTEVAAHFGAIRAGRDYFAPAPTEGPATLAFNEVAANTNSPFWFEIINHGEAPVELGNFQVVLDGTVNVTNTLPTGALAPGAIVAVTNAAARPPSGDKLFLVRRPGVGGEPVADAVTVTDRLRGRHPAGTGRWLYPNQPTPGAANSFAFRDEIVINEIMYHPRLIPATETQPARESPEAWIELFNRSSNAVDLAGWELGCGISYRFVAGQSIPAGGYLVVADDVGYLQAVYPGITIVGDFAGRLSGKSDRIVLRDPTGNPADEVTYYDNGKWPGYADGGGSSLELRDPNADNAKAEAWAASDESHATTWQTFTYRAQATIPAANGQPTTWNDFVFGLLDQGECLVDDIRVTESPAGTPVQFLSNGDFESGMSGWRVLGTHNRSTVIPEPGNPGNHVLHLVATGPQEHMHNHIERTYNAGRVVQSSREYEISFRARWLAGNNLLNTRLYFNRAGRTTPLPTPAHGGTPGARNSRYEPNIGPTFAHLQHSPVVPPAGQAVTVAIEATDPQGVATVELWWSVNSGVWNSTSMQSTGGGHYVGVIPGQTAGAVVQFYVRATDSLGAAAMFPARGPDSGALYKVEDGQADLALAHNFRIVMTPDNINLMHGTAQGVNQTNVMSNELLPCTIIYDERRVYYDCGVHLRGSQRGRYNDVRTGFHVNFQPDDLFRGVHPVMLIDRSGAGDATGNRQEEVVIKHMLNRAGGIPGTYTEICRVLAPRSAHTGPAQLFPRHEDVMIETLHDNGNDGKMFEMELIYYPITANAAGYKNPQPDNVIGTDITDLGNDKEFYRYNFMIKNHRDADDYSGFIALAKAWSLTGEALDEQTRQLMDLDQWMRAYAIVSLCAVGDTYTFGNNHNFFTYQRPSDGKFEFFPWDMDFAFSRGANAGLVGDQNLGKIVNRPANLRRFYAHCLDIINICFNTAYMAYWTDHYDNFAPGQNYGGSLTTIGARATFVRNTINTSGGNAPFAVAASNLVSGSGLLYLSGTAPVGVQVIKVNGVEYPVTWTSVTAWRIALPAPAGTNDLEIAGHDLRGQPMPGFVRTVRIENPVPTPDPTGAVVINEIMYNPLRPEAAYVELYNRSSSAIDLSGWRLNGLDYTFPPGSFITNGQYLVLAASMVGYNATLGASAPVPFAEFPGNLQNDGETLTLFRPGPDNTEIVVDKVRYESLPPWPISANGTGPSLQLIDAGQDNSRVANWSDGQGWRFYSFTGTPGANATNLLLFLATAGDVYIDDLALVEGPAPGVGFNFVANGDFESGALAPWRAIGQHSNTVVSSEVAHSGNHSLHIVAGSPGGVNSTLAQAVALSNSSAPHTLSFWFLPSTNGSGVSFRLTTAFRSLTPVNYRPVFSSPGTANTVAGVRPPFPDLWLNEVQPENTIGLTDSVGEREPWIEIYNAGTNVIDLAGCFLTDNYSNLTRWAFPPNSSIAPGEFKIIIADGEPQESTATEWHASFRPSPGTGTVALAWTPLAQVEVLDYLNYAFVRPGRSYGAWPDAQPFDRQEFHRPTPGAPNDNTPPPATVFLNEWMASNTRTLINTNRGNRYDDWFEIYNPADTPADLAGYTLTDNLSNPDQFVIPQGYVVPARGFLLVWADGAPELNRPTDPALHVNFSLRREGEAIGLYASDGTEIDAVTFEPQFNDYSQGRVADGQPAIYFLAAATPAAPNSGWANRPPVLDPIDDAVTGVGETLTLIPTASDPDSPPQTWQFSLVNAPAGAAIDPVSGVFTWMSLALSTNTITVRVTDNGTPALSATRSFTIVTGIRVVGITPPANGEVRFAVSTIPGKTYQVEYKNNLADPEWTPLGPPQIAADGTLVIIDSAGAQGQRFYRVIQTN